jgi:hypothetical protein
VPARTKIRGLILEDTGQLTNTSRTVAAKQRNIPGKAGDAILAEREMGALEEV